MTPFRGAGVTDRSGCDTGYFPGRFLTYVHDAIYFLDTANVKAEIAKQSAANPQGWEDATDQEKCTFLFNKLARPWSKGLDQILYPTKYECRK